MADSPLVEDAASVKTLVSETEKALGRPEQPLPTDMARSILARERILITGAKGSIGQALGLDGHHTDIDDLDVTRGEAVGATLRRLQPTLIFHLAGMKYAPEGEESPSECIQVNALGTENVIRKAQMVGARVITASTCKAAEPETCYGATKLLAERMTLNAGGTVVRFYNVVETAGNVFEIWRNVPEGEPIRHSPCQRYFISRAEAVSLLLNAAVLDSGRYAFHPGPSRYMGDVARDLYPTRRHEMMDARRGDRITEPLCGEQETTDVRLVASRLIRIESPHD